ncbi:ATP-binding protein [Nocardia sp. NPDC058658]|uniref:ATP-binding protein n=1 Tax=Nocardia sp. NPDC058658 TaxID=3346580 RepID=UPI003661AC21
MPWLVEQDGEFEGALQTVWDRDLSGKPVLLILVGSDISVMEALGACDRPFFGRATKMTIDPLDVADVQAMTGLDAAAAIDARLITGGFPQILTAWRPGMDRLDFLRESTTDPLSPLLVAGELSLLGEFPEGTRSRAVLQAIGSGERTFGTIAAQAGSQGDLAAGTLNPLLKTLQDKRIVAADRPLSTVADTKNKRYRITDSYLRFWLAFLERGIPLVERGRGDIALSRIERSWTSWRGRAVEPLIRASLLRLLPDENWPDTEEIGGWWNRANNPEVDLIGADRSPVAKSIQFVGSIKWLDDHPFDRHDYDALSRCLLAVPGTDPNTPLVAVSRAGTTTDAPVSAWWGPEELVAAWRR